MTVTPSDDDTVSRPRIFSILDETMNEKWLFILTCVVAAVLIAVNVPRLFEFNFWGDEAMSILQARKPTLEIITYAMKTDAHPPVFNLMVSLMTTLFGTSPFVYHLVPFIPYVGILIISVTFVRKYFGTLSAIIFMLLATFLDSATYFIPEVRMYELGAFFVLASYVSLYIVLKNGDKKSFAWFVVTSLFAAYTHYYCLVAVGLFFAGLFVHYVLRRDWKTFKIYIVASIITILAYLPWVMTSLINTIERVARDFWIQESMSLEESILYMFNNSTYLYTFIILFSLVILAMVARTLWKKYGNKTAQKTEDNYELPWVIIGLFSVIGSILIGQYLSSTMTPLVIERYLYPVSVIAWLILAVGVSRLTSRKYIQTTISMVVIVMILVICVPNFCATVEDEQEKNESTAKIIDLTYDYLSEGDTIVTNMNHMRQSLKEIYFPDLKLSYINEDTKIVPKLDHSHNNLMFLTYEVQVVDIEDQLTEQGFEVIVLDRGYFASIYYVAVYELRPIPTE